MKLQTTYSNKFNISALFTGFLFFFLTIVTNPVNAQQQNPEQLSLSLGASAGYAPTLTFGDYEDSGGIIGLSGDLQYQNIIGQLDFVYVLSETVGNDFFMSGIGFFGSLGYKYVASDRVHIPIMVTGGASIIEYGAGSTTFKDVSPQIGFTLAPYYMLNENTSVYGSIRYMNGFKGSDESEPIDVFGITVGLRFTLL